MKRLVWILFLIALPAQAADDAVFALTDNCVKCHLTAERTGKPNSALSWKQSVHFRADSGCADCHGGDKFYYMDFKKGHMGLPSRGQALSWCSKCHRRAYDDFVYANRAVNVGKPACTADCISCHGYHKTPKADAATQITRESCGSCHTMEKTQSLSAALGRVLASMDRMEAEIRDRRARGLAFESHEEKLNQARKSLARAFHQNSPDLLEQAIGGKISVPLSSLAHGLKRDTPEKWRAQGGLVLGFLLIVLFFSLVWLWTAQKRKRNNNP